MEPQAARRSAALLLSAALSATATPSAAQQQASGPEVVQEHASVPVAQAADSSPVPIVREPAEWNLGAGQLAIEGYDPVAYFPEGGGRPAKGDSALTIQRDGATYRFATAAHRDLFLNDPARYAPAFGGWCAFAMGQEQGEKVEVDPESFLVTDGRLLLFYDGLFADTRAKWIEAKGAALPTADANWKRFSGEEPRLGVRPHDVAPDFELEDEAGAAVRLSGLKGQPVVLVFWARWSEPSLRGLREFSLRFADRPMRVLAIDAFEREPQAGAGDAAPSTGGRCTVLLDGDAVARRYGVEALPTFVLIGSDGRIVFRTAGWSAGLESAMPAAPNAPAENQPSQR